MGKRKGKQLGSTEDYRNLLRIAARLKKQGFLQRFQSDLIKHDKAGLKDYEGPYLWAIREGGTHLLTPEGACYGVNHDKAWRDLPKIFSEKIKIYYSNKSGHPPRAVSAAVAGQIAGKWERSCKIRKSFWTGKPI